VLHKIYTLSQEPSHQIQVFLDEACQSRFNLSTELMLYEREIEAFIVHTHELQQQIASVDEFIHNIKANIAKSTQKRQSVRYFIHSFMQTTYLMILCCQPKLRRACASSNSTASTTSSSTMSAMSTGHGDPTSPSAAVAIPTAPATLE
jgi:hypothetical protein